MSPKLIQALKSALRLPFDCLHRSRDIIYESETLNERKHRPQPTELGVM